MNNEIKEILEFKEDADYKRLSIDEIDILRDYITNLQEENKLLKIWKEDLLNENIDIENIRKEAIDYIKSESWFCYKDNEEVIDRTPVEKLIKILEGDKDEIL